VTSPLVVSFARDLAAMVLAVEETRPPQRADTGQMLIWLLVAGVVIGVVSAMLVIANRVARRWRYNSHPAVFRALCKLHGLDGPSRRLLRRVVRYHRLSQPGRLFVEPKWLDPANLGAAFQPLAAELETLRNSLFNVRTSENPRS
jgi:hypothetical protein